MTFYCSPSCCDKSDCGVDLLNGDCHVVVCHDCVGRFDDSHGFCDDDASGLSHGCEQQEDEPSSSLLDAFSPRACQEHRPLCRQSGIALGLLANLK